MNYNTIIIGAGIAGMSAAMYLKRANIDVCIIESSTPGGQLLRTSTVENYPGIPKTDGASIAINIFNQVNELNIPIMYKEVISIKKDEELKVITKDNEYTCKNIIIATGRNYKKLQVEGESKLTGKGISYCATCDGNLYKDKKVAVIGAGNSAFEEALYLSKICRNVTIFVRSDQFRADNSLIEEVKNTENIEIRTNKLVNKIIGEEKLEKLSIKDKETEEEIQEEFDGCFIFIGQTPTTYLLKDLDIELDKEYIITNETMETNVKNIYAIGDCRKKQVYQLITASNDGIIAANQIIRNRGK